MKTRRQILKTSAAAGLTYSILPSFLCGKTAPSKRINLAIIGTGRQGVERNLRTFLGMDNVHIVSVCDVDRLRMGYGKRLVDEAYGNTDCKMSLEKTSVA